MFTRFFAGWGLGTEDTVSETSFITLWKTDNAGTTASNQINFRVEAASDFNIDWGDGNNEDFLGLGDLIHTYSSAGTYTITVTGDLTFSLINNGDNAKFVDVLQHGSVKYLSGIRTFFGASLTVMSATDVPDLSLVSNMRAWFLNCGTLTSITNFGLWNISTVNDIINTFSGCTLYDQDISTLDFSNITLAIGFLGGGAGLSTVNYDLLWVSLGGQTLQNGVQFDGGTSTYTLGSAADTARTNVITTYGWTVNDGGGI